MLQVLFVVVVIGLISQVPHRSEANFRESCQGQDEILTISIVIHCVELPLKTLFIFRCVCELCCELKTCNILLPLKCSVVDCMISPTYAWFTCIRS